MRSRFVAYARGHQDYIVHTTDPDGSAWQLDEAAWRSSIATFCESTAFERLELSESITRENEAWVTFAATLRQGERDASFAERSYFRRVQGRWLYHSGERLQ